MKIQLNNINKTYAGELVLNELNLEIIKGSKVAIVGENGSGKSTLLKILAQIENFQEGELIIPKEMHVGYMRQVYPDFEGSAKSFILQSFNTYNELKRKLSEMELEMSENYNDALLERYSKTTERFIEIDGYDLENTLDSYAKGLGVYEVLDDSFNQLSGGQKTRLGLVKLLLEDVNVLCLDEPTNHLDIAGIEWLESFCKTTSKTVVVVSHDRKFLMNTVNVFHEIEYGAIVTYHGNYDQFRKQKHQRFLRLVNDYEQQQKEISKLKINIRRYRQWAHEADNEDMYRKAKMLERRLEAMVKLPRPQEIKNRLDFDLNINKEFSKEVVVANDLSIGYDIPLIESLNFTIRHGDHFAIVAKNGVGKSTLIKTILQEIEPLSGSIRVGNSTKIGYLAQQIEFPKNVRILEYVMKECALTEEEARRTLARFNFFKEDVYKIFDMLSGGEKVRLKLLEIMMQQINCIILDEPTNHLDIESCEIIEEVLLSFKGTIIIVSHDRMLLENLNTINLAL